MPDPTTCPHGVTLGQRCFACNSADTLPLTMPDQLSRELAEAREKLARLQNMAMAESCAHDALADIEDGDVAEAKRQLRNALALLGGAP